MKSFVVVLGLLFTGFAYANTIDVPAEYELLEVEASCKKLSCAIDEETGAEQCRYKIFLSEQSFEEVKNLKKEKGLNKTWYSKSPNALCSTGELPLEGEGTGVVSVLVYKLDMSVLNGLFE